MTQRVLVAGIGNDLMGDDGFGIVTIRRLAARGVPAGVRLLESGIAGISLVQELLDRYGAVIILDAAERGARPGTLQLLTVDVPDPRSMSKERHRELMSDLHLAVPSRALILARALDALPERVFMLVCQPGEVALGIGLTPAVESAVDAAVERVLALVATLPAPSTSETPMTGRTVALAAR